MIEIVAADIGGTHARFAIATLEGGKSPSLGEPVTLKVADYPDLPAAWADFARRAPRPLPRVASIAVAAPVSGDTIDFTNNHWTIARASLAAELALDDHILLNDFGAIGHAVASLGPSHFDHLCGPDDAFPRHGVLSIVGPGTGLGIAHVLRRDGRAFVSETVGGHLDFAPLDETEDAILAHLRTRFGRVSMERLISGPGLANIHQALAASEGRTPRGIDDQALWTSALAGDDPRAVAVRDRFCLIFGAICGDLALAHGACGVVVAGGIGQRLAAHLPRSGFAGRFTAKGRFAAMMATIPVKRITHPEPGLYGAAAAYAEARR